MEVTRCFISQRGRIRELPVAGCGRRCRWLGYRQSRCCSQIAPFRLRALWHTPRYPAEFDMNTKRGTSTQKRAEKKTLTGFNGGRLHRRVEARVYLRGDGTLEGFIGGCFIRNVALGSPVMFCHLRGKSRNCGMHTDNNKRLVHILWCGNICC